MPYSIKDLEKKDILSIAEPPLWVPLVGGLLVATGWYRWGYMRRHPFLGAMFGFMWK